MIRSVVQAAILAALPILTGCVRNERVYTADEILTATRGLTSEEVRDRIGEPAQVLHMGNFVWMIYPDLVWAEQNGQKVVAPFAAICLDPTPGEAFLKVKGPPLLFSVWDGPTSLRTEGSRMKPWAP